MPRSSPTRHVAGVSSQVGSRIRQKRQEAGLTLEDVSESTGIPTSSLSRFEKGVYQLTLPKLEVLATALQCLTSDLLTESTEGGGSSGSS